MTFVKANDLCESCSCQIPRPIRKSGVIDLSDFTTYIMDCIYEDKRHQTKVVQCNKFRAVEGAFKVSCLLCRTKFFVYFDMYEEKDSIDVLEGKCPGCYANLRVQMTKEILPTTLEQWKETGELTKKNKIGMKFYPSANIRQSVLVSLKDAFGLPDINIPRKGT